MNNFKKLITICLSTLVFSGTIAAQENTFDKTEIHNQITTGLNVAVAQINQPAIEHIAKVQLDHMTFMQNVEQFLRLAKYNKEMTTATIKIVAE